MCVCVCVGVVGSVRFVGQDKAVPILRGCLVVRNRNMISNTDR